MQVDSENTISKRELQQLIDLLQESYKQETAWCQHLLTLATGALTLLAIFQSDLSGGLPQSPQIAWLLGTTWFFLGMGIVSGFAATYRQVNLAQRQAMALWKELGKSLDNREPGDAIMSPSQPKILRPSKTVMVWSLLLAVVSLVTYSILRALTL